MEWSMPLKFSNWLGSKTSNILRFPIRFFIRNTAWQEGKSSQIVWESLKIWWWVNFLAIKLAVWSEILRKFGNLSKRCWHFLRFQLPKSVLQTISKHKIRKKSWLLSLLYLRKSSCEENQLLRKNFRSLLRKRRMEIGLLISLEAMLSRSSKNMLLSSDLPISHSKSGFAKGGEGAVRVGKALCSIGIWCMRRKLR